MANTSLCHQIIFARLLSMIGFGLAVLAIPSTTSMTRASEPVDRVAVAQELLDIERKIIDVEETALAVDTDYQTALHRLAKSEVRWAAHREVFEKQRDADPDYIELKSAFNKQSQVSMKLESALPEAMVVYKAERRILGKLNARARKIDKQILRLKADVEKYSNNASRNSEKAMKAMVSNDGRGNTASSKYGRSSTHYREKAAEAEDEIRSLKKELQAISKEFYSPEMNKSKASYDEAEAHARKARSELNDIKVLFDTTNTKLESVFNEDPATVRLTEDLEFARSQVEAARKHAIESISDRCYLDLIRERDHLHAELHPR